MKNKSKVLERIRLKKHKREMEHKKWKKQYNRNGGLKGLLATTYKDFKKAKEAESNKETK